MRIYYTYHGQQQVRDVERKDILIGRLSPLSAPDIDLGDDPTVSRKHCRIKQSGDGCVIEDLRSTNGTVVDEQFVETAAINPKSSIRLGETAIRVELRLQPGTADAGRIGDESAPFAQAILDSPSARLLKSPAAKEGRLPCSSSRLSCRRADPSSRPEPRRNQRRPPLLTSRLRLQFRNPR